MKRRALAGVLAVMVCIGTTGVLQTGALADTAVIEEDMDDSQLEETDWKLQQELSTSSCRQGKNVTLAVTLRGDGKTMQLSTIYAKLKYDPNVFRVKKSDITPMKSGLADYISFDKALGEIDIYYADDIAVDNGTTLFKIRLHTLSDADIGATKVGVEEIELYAMDSDAYVVIENAGTVKADIQKSTAAALPGDVNQDKKISLTDVKWIMRYCNGTGKLSAAQKKNADVNKDGNVTLTDAKLIMKYCNGEIKKL